MERHRSRLIEGERRERREEKREREEREKGEESERPTVRSRVE